MMMDNQSFSELDSYDEHIAVKCAGNSGTDLSFDLDIGANEAVSVIRRKQQRNQSQWCSAINCSNSRLKKPDLSFFRFPKDEERCRKWVINCRRQDLLNKSAKALYNGNVLCCNHFEDSQFANGKRSQLKRLKAIPTLFDVPNSPCILEAKRPPPKVRKMTETIQPALAEQESHHEQSTSLQVDQRLHQRLFYVKKTKMDSKNHHCKWCAAINCRNSKNRRPDLAFFRFPKDPLRCKQWVINCRRKDLERKTPDELYRSTTLCSEHFESCCFKKTKTATQRLCLKKNTIPSKFDVPNPTPKLTTSRPPPKKRLFICNEVSDNGSPPDVSQEPSTSTENSDEIINGKQRFSSASVCSHVTVLTFQDEGTASRMSACLTIPHHSQRKPVNVKKEVTCGDVNPKYPIVTKLLNADYKGRLPNASLPATSTDNSIVGQYWKDGHSCPKCNLVFPTGAFLEIHTKQQHHESALKVIQENAKSPNASSEEKAENGLSGDELAFGSSQCEDNAITSQTRESSSLRYDGDNKCGVFSNSSSLRAHMMKTHCGEMGFLCNKCSKMYCSESELKLHMHSHYNDRSKHGRKWPHKMKEGKLFQCDRCGRCYLDSRNLVRHLEKNHKQIEFYCNVCGMIFSSCNLLLAHSRIHKGEKPYPCDECGRSFNQKNSFKSHKKVHLKYSMSKEGLYLCHMCGKGFLKTKSLSRHVKIHKRKKSKCKDCGKLFSSSAALKRHKTTHTGEKPHVCHTCGKAFSQITHLRLHILTHTGERPHLCHTCGSAFSQITHLRKHMLTHSGEKPFECQTCGKSFTRREGLTVHIRTHTGERPYICDTCGKSFSQTNTLYIHKRIHTGTVKKQYKLCDVCGKYFSGSLSAHMIIHSEKKKSFTCTQCGRTFGNLRNLTRHVRIHTGEKPYACEICSKKFRQKTHFVAHLRTHTGERPFKCDICSRGFIERRCLLRHMEKKHFDKLHVTTKNI